MRFHIAREYLVAKRLDHPLVSAGQMQACGVFVAKITGIKKPSREIVLAVAAGSLT